MKIDLRYKDAPLFAISIALYLSTATMAGAAPAAVKASSTKRPNTPDEAMRSMTASQIGQVGAGQPAFSFPQPSKIIPSALKTVAQRSPSTATVPTNSSSAPQITNTAATRGVSPLDRIVAGITNKSSGQAIYIPASPKAKAVVTATSPVRQPAANSELSEVNALSPAIASANVPPSDMPFPDAETKANLPQEQPQASKETFIAQPSADSTALSSSQWTNLSGIGNLTSNLVSNSKKMVLSIRSDSSALLSMGSASLEIPSAFSSRLVLGNTVQLSQLPNLNDSDSGILSIQIPRRGNNSAMRLLLTQKGTSGASTLIVQNENQKSVAFSVIGIHRFSNKPNV
jgi:hypothetical protein